jgi:hypothetical protein
MRHRLSVASVNSRPNGFRVERRVRARFARLGIATDDAVTACPARVDDILEIIIVNERGVRLIDRDGVGGALVAGAFEGRTPRFMRHFAKRQRTDGETGDPPKGTP